MRKALYILADLKDEDLKWMSEAGSYQMTKAGDILIAKDEPITTLYIIIDGKFDVVIGSGETIAERAAGDIVGEMSLVEKRPPSASIRATSEGKVLAVPQEAIQERIESDDAFAARFYRALAVFLSDRMRSTVSMLGYGEVREEDLQEVFEDAHELDEGILDNLHVAGDRMRRLISILEGQ